MTLPILLLALAQPGLQAKPSGESASSAPLIQKQEVVYPGKQELAPAPNDYLSWRGWSYLQGASPSVPALYDSVGDWTEIKSHIATARDPKCASWRCRFVIFTRVESDERDSKGILREHRQTLESVQLSHVQASIERLRGWVSARFGGKVELLPDVQIESDWMRDAGNGTQPPFGKSFLQHYLEPRINGGSYEAEDKVFRGPFQSAIVMLPGANIWSPETFEVNLTPIGALSAQPLDRNGLELNLDDQLRTLFLKQVEDRVRIQGFKGMTLGGAPNTEDGWSLASTADEPASDALVKRANETIQLAAPGPDPVPAKVAVLPEFQASLVADQEKGQVLKVSETSGFRTGGAWLPSRNDGMPLAKLDATPTLSLSIKPSSSDPLAIRLESTDGKRLWVSLGPEPACARPWDDEPVVTANVVPNGTWQKVLVDLKAVAAKVGMSDVARMSIEPTPNDKLAGKIRPEPLEWCFDEIKFTSEPATNMSLAVAPDSQATEPESRALFAAKATVASPELVALLRDKSDLVKLNATVAYQTIKDPNAESSLISNSLDLDGTIAAEALKSLMFQGTEKATAVVRQSVRVAFTDYAKQTAALLLGATKDTKVAGDISLLLGCRSWQAWVAGVDALAMINTPSAGQISLTFINGVDPAIKVEVTKNADPSRDQDVRTLLWSSVNEPSDMVRAESDIKLIQSTVAANRTEGYKGVRDDSRWVRILVLRYLAAHPNEDNRSVLRLGVADRSAVVRAEALNGFAALAEKTSLDEIANVLEDQNPVVQLALINLSKTKGLKLPKKTIDAMNSSFDSRVSTASKGLESTSSLN